MKKKQKSRSQEPIIPHNSIIQSNKANEDIDYVIKLNYIHPFDIIFKNNLIHNISSSALILNYQDLKSKSSLNIQSLKGKTKKSLKVPTIISDQKKISQLVQMSIKEKIEYEKGSEAKREELKKRMKELKEEIAHQYQEFDIQSKIFDNLKLEIDILSNFKSYLRKKISNNKVNKKGLNDSFNNITQYQNDKKSTQYQGQIDQVFKVNREQKEMSLIGITFEKKKIKEKIKELNYLLIEAKNEYEDIKRELYMYYHQLLSEGIDCRKDGLIWIIKKIWNLGGIVMVSSFPNFLDKLTIDFLFALAAKSVNLDSVKNQIDGIKAEIDNKNKQLSINNETKKNDNNDRHIDKEQKLKSKKFKPNYSCFLSRNNEFVAIDDEDQNKQYNNNSISNCNSKNLCYMGSSMNSTLNSSLKYLSNKSLQTILNQLSQLSQEDKKRMETTHKKVNSVELEKLETYYIKLNKEIKLMRKRELNRINKEFYLNDYSRRYGIKQETIISEVIGQELASMEMKRAKAEQKEYFQIIKELKNGIQIPKELQYSFLTRDLNNNNEDK